MDDVTCERITSSIDNVLRKDKNIDEFDVVYSTGDANKSPVIHIDHKLGLESWCVPHVYKYASSSIQLYKKTSSYHVVEPLLRWTQLCLLIMPELTLFWNIRRQLTLKGLGNFERELILSKLVLSRKAKCIEAFQYRRWLFTTAAKRSQFTLSPIISPSINLVQILWGEFELCSRSAVLCANNYHAWNHRLSVLEHLGSLEDLAALYKSEYLATEKWVNYHVSEYSGMHYRSKVIDFIRQAYENGALCLQYIDGNFHSVLNLYEKELTLNKNLIEFHSGHESLLYYRKVLLVQLRHLINGQSSEIENYSSNSCTNQRSIERNSEWCGFLSQELEWVGKKRNSAPFYQYYIDWISKFLT